MLITLELDSDTPLYEQLRNQIILGIATGRLTENEKLPTVRQLARDLGLNVMTVNKAYALLKQEGYIAIDRRHGARVRPRQSSGADDPEHSAKLERELRLLIAQAVIKGMDPPRFHNLCAQIFAQMMIPKDGSPCSS